MASWVADPNDERDRLVNAAIRQVLLTGGSVRGGGIPIPHLVHIICEYVRETIRTSLFAPSPFELLPLSPIPPDLSPCCWYICVV